MKKKNKKDWRLAMSRALIALEVTHSYFMVGIEDEEIDLQIHLLKTIKMCREALK